MDTATGLLYVGNGQYYDPSTGRFLNHNANPNGTNPYVPWGGEPSAAFMAPLALLSLFYSRKRKRGTLDTFVILLVLGVAFGLSLAACGTSPQPTAPTPVIVQVGTNQWVAVINGTPVAVGPTPRPAGTPLPKIIATACATPSLTVTVTGTPTGTPTPTGTTIVVDDVNLSSYYTVLESEYGGGKTQIYVTEENNRRTKVGTYLIRKEELTENVKYTNFVSSAQTAKGDFLYDPTGLCVEGSGKLENGLYISCVDNPNHITGFDWLPDNQVNNVISHPLEVAAFCKTSATFQKGDVIEIPDLQNIMINYEKNDFFTITDTGEGLCTGNPNGSLDIYAGEGRSLFPLTNQIIAVDHARVIIHRGMTGMP